jgi:hypothetical protein
MVRGLAMGERGRRTDGVMGCDSYGKVDITSRGDEVCQIERGCGIRDQ